MYKNFLLFFILFGFFVLELNYNTSVFLDWNQAHGERLTPATNYVPSTDNQAEQETVSISSASSNSNEQASPNSSSAGVTNPCDNLIDIDSVDSKIDSLGTQEGNLNANVLGRPLTPNEDSEKKSLQTQIGFCKVVKRKLQREENLKKQCKEDE